MHSLVFYTCGLSLAVFIALIIIFFPCAEKKIIRKLHIFAEITITGDTIAFLYKECSNIVGTVQQLLETIIIILHWELQIIPACFYTRNVEL